MTAQVGVLFSEPQLAPLSTYGKIQPFCTRKFFLSQSTTQANVYRDAALRLPLAQPIAADKNGRFGAIYLDPTLIYRSQLFNAAGQLLEDEDPYITPPPFQFAVVKQVATSRPSTTVAAADPELTITIPGPGTYVFDALLEFITTGASGVSPGVVVTPVFGGAFLDGANSSFSIIGNMNAAGVDNFGSLNGTGAGAAGITATAYSLAGASVKNTLMFKGVFKATEPGVLSINWAQQTSNATATTLNAGSYLRYVGFGAGSGDSAKGGTRPSVVNLGTVSNPTGPVIFIATYGAGITTTSYIYSFDGVNWKVGTFPTTQNYAGLAYGGTNPQWVVTMNTNDIHTSQDGLTWTQHAGAIPTLHNWNDVAWSPTLGLFAAVSSSGTATDAATSPDGVTWTMRATPTFGFTSVIWSARLGLFIAGRSGGFSTAPVMTSPDGITWTSRTVVSSCVSSLMHDFGGSFGVIGYTAGGTSYSRSTDGLTWTGLSIPSLPGGGNNTGMFWQTGGNVWSIQGSSPYKLLKTPIADLSSGWVDVSDTPAPGLSGAQPQQTAYSASLNMWAMTGGASGATFILTSVSGPVTVYNPTNAVALTLSRIAASG